MEMSVTTPPAAGAPVVNKVSAVVPTKSAPWLYEYDANRTWIEYLGSKMHVEAVSRLTGRSVLSGPLVFSSLCLGMDALKDLLWFLDGLPEQLFELIPRWPFVAILGPLSTSTFRSFLVGPLTGPCSRLGDSLASRFFRIPRTSATNTSFMAVSLTAALFALESPTRSFFMKHKFVLSGPDVAVATLTVVGIWLNLRAGMLYDRQTFIAYKEEEEEEEEKQESRAPPRPTPLSTKAIILMHSFGGLALFLSGAALKFENLNIRTTSAGGRETVVGSVIKGTLSWMPYIKTVESLLPWVGVPLPIKASDAASAVTKPMEQLVALKSMLALAPTASAVVGLILYGIC